MEFSLSGMSFFLHQEGTGRSVLDGAAPMLATLFLAPGLTNVEMRPTRVVGRGGVSCSVLQYSFMVVWRLLLLWGTVWMWDFAWKNWLEHEHEQAYDYDNRGQVCFRLYCLWVGLSCLAVFLWPAGSALGSGAVAADQGTVKTKSRLGAVSGQSSWCCIEGEPIWLFPKIVVPPNHPFQ